MSGNYFLQMLWLLVLMVGSCGYVKAATYLATPCVSLEEIAVDSLHSSGLSALTAKGGSYRVSEVRWDSVLAQRWAMVISCEHPEQPAFAILTRGSITEKTPFKEMTDSAALVHAGEVVRLWRQEENLRIEVTAMSEESGGLGKKIRVRLIGSDSSEMQFVGIVRGIADVEMQR